VKRWEREKILREGGALDFTVRSQSERRMVEHDLEGNPFAGQRVRQRLRNFRPGVDSYVSALHGPLVYMQRLRMIHEEELAHEERLRAAWLELAASGDDAERFAASWRLTAARWNLTAINLLIDKHNRYFPAESRLPMDPRTGDFILVGGRPYRRDPLDAAWVLERFPPDLAAARSVAASQAA
jgi:hypothetical protein